MDEIKCRASISNIMDIDCVITDVGVIFADTHEVLVLTLETLDKEMKPLGLRVSWTILTVQLSGVLVDNTVHISCGRGVDIEVL